MLHVVLLISLVCAAALRAPRAPPPAQGLMGVVDPVSFFERAGPWDERDLSSLLGANKAWSEKMKTNNPAFFEEGGQVHAPKILWIGCSDARVPANEMIGEPPGSVFVHRNVANMVVNTDFNCMSVIQYAVDVLKVKHIIVCGHYDCGGVRAALEPVDHKSPLENWLRNIRDNYRLHKEELNSIPTLRERQRRMVELNVIEQCLNIYKTAVVQKSRAETYSSIGTEGTKHTFAEPRVHAIVYEPKSGIATKLTVNFKEYIDDLRGVYDLYTVQKKGVKQHAPSKYTATSTVESAAASTAASISASTSTPASTSAPVSTSASASLDLDADYPSDATLERFFDQLF